jgi:nucleotide-binding universal stress UspA family protein
MNAMVAIQPGEEARILLEQAVAWAARMGAKMHLRTASELLWTPFEAFGGSAADAALTEAWAARRDAEAAYLKKLMDDVPAPMRGSTDVLQGRAHSAILDEAPQHDLVMIGTHGRRGVERVFLGSVAEQVVRRCPKPVLVLRSDGKPVPLDRTLKVLVPVDAADPHIRAAIMAGQMFGENAEVHLVYALPDLRLYESAGMMVLGHTTAETHPQRKWAEERLGDLQHAYSLDLRCHYIVRTAENPAGDLAKFATTVGADVISLPTHGRTGVERIAYGSVAERLVRLAQCPVLVVR